MSPETMTPSKEIGMCSHGNFTESCTECSEGEQTQEGYATRVRAALNTETDIQKLKDLLQEGQDTFGDDPIFMNKGGDEERGLGMGDLLEKRIAELEGKQ